MKPKLLFFRGHNGKLEKLISNPFEKPFTEMNLDQYVLTNDAWAISISGTPIQDIKEYLEVAYKTWGRFGYLGDIIVFKVINLGNVDYYYLEYIVNLVEINFFITQKVNQQ